MLYLLVAVVCLFTGGFLEYRYGTKVRAALKV